MNRDNSHLSPAVAPVLDAELTARLRAVAASLRRYVLIEGVGWVVLVLAAAMTIQILLDYYSYGLQRSMRAVLLGLIVLGGLWLIIRRLLQPLRIPCGLPEIANLVERRHPHLATSLISAVRFCTEPPTRHDGRSAALTESVVRQASTSLSGLSLDSILNPRRARNAGFALLGVLAFTLTALALSRDLVRIGLARNALLREVPWPKQTELIVELVNGELIGARGDDVIVQARAEGKQPRAVEISFETQSGQRGRESMTTVGSDASFRYRHTFKNAQEELTFRLTGGDDRTPPYRLRLLDRPEVEATEMRVTPPRYTKLPPTNFPDGQRAAQVLPGSNVSLWVKTNKTVASASLLSGELLIGEAESDAGRYRVDFTPSMTRTYAFRLVDDFGLDNRRQIPFALRLIKDEAPTVRMKLQGVGDMVTPDAVLPVEVDFADGYGLARAELQYLLSRDEGVTKQIKLPGFTPDATTYTQRLDWQLSSAGAVAGETLTLAAEGADFDDVSGPNVTRSSEVRLRVVTREELLAELARREQEYRADFERIVDAQEQVRRQLLTDLGAPGIESRSADFTSTVAALERRQRNISASVNVVRQQFERILIERRINRLSTDEEETRLGTRIVEPLSNLAKRELTAAADAIHQLTGTRSAELAARVDVQQVQILARMREILANMLQWEGYQEVVTMLRDIIRLQRELKAETQETAKKQADETFKGLDR